MPRHTEGACPPVGAGRESFDTVVGVSRHPVITVPARLRVSGGRAAIILPPPTAIVTGAVPAPFTVADRTDAADKIDAAD